MEDLDYNGATEVTQGTLDTILEHISYGLTTIDYYITKYDPIKFPVVEAGDAIVPMRHELEKAVIKYNTYRPHFNLKGMTPYEYYNSLSLGA